MIIYFNDDYLDKKGEADEKFKTVIVPLNDCGYWNAFTILN